MAVKCLASPERRRVPVGRAPSPDTTIGGVEVDDADEELAVAEREPAGLRKLIE